MSKITVDYIESELFFREKEGGGLIVHSSLKTTRTRDDIELRRSVGYTLFTVNPFFPIPYQEFDPLF